MWCPQVRGQRMLGVGEGQLTRFKDAAAASLCWKPWCFFSAHPWLWGHSRKHAVNILLATRQTLQEPAVHSQSSRKKSRKRCRRWNLCTGPSLLKLKEASLCLWTKNPTAGPPVTKPCVIQPSISTQPLPPGSLCFDPATLLGAAPWWEPLWPVELHSGGWQALCPRQAHRRPRSCPPRCPQTFLLQP